PPISTLFPYTTLFRSHSIYDVLEKDLGIVIDHGVATFRPVRADRTVAQRLGIRRGELLLAIWQIDYDEEDRPVLSSHEYHIADRSEEHTSELQSPYDL